MDSHGILFGHTALRKLTDKFFRFVQIFLRLYQIPLFDMTLPQTQVNEVEIITGWIVKKGGTKIIHGMTPVFEFFVTLPSSDKCGNRIQRGIIFIPKTDIRGETAAVLLQSLFELRLSLFKFL